MFHAGVTAPVDLTQVRLAVRTSIKPSADEYMLLNSTGNILLQRADADVRASSDSMNGLYAAAAQPGFVLEAKVSCCECVSSVKSHYVLREVWAA